MNPGAVLDGRFRVVERGGAGGMGAVFRGEEISSGQAVAIKILDASIDRERARREGLALRSLDHPAIVRYIAGGETPDGCVFLVMEWLEGATVGDRIAEDGFTLVEAVAVIRQVALALAVAHEAGIVHRDIKPSNIVLVGDRIDAVKLIDFGVARIAAASSLTRTGTTMGTPGYMAPEQARGDRELTAAVDVFGLGCVLYECIAGRPAFSGSMVAALMTKILISDPVPLARICPEVPASVSRLIDKLLAKDPQRRLGSAADVVAELDALGGLPSTKRRSSQELVEEATRPPVPRPATSHCVVISSRGAPDDVVEAPASSQLDALDAASKQRGGRVEVLASGVVIAHFAGARVDVEANAIAYADDARRIIPEFVTVISDVDEDVGGAVDRSTLELSHRAMTAIFAPR